MNTVIHPFQHFIISKNILGVYLVLQNCLIGFDVSEIYYETFDWIREEEDTIMLQYIHMVSI